MIAGNHNVFPHSQRLKQTDILKRPCQSYAVDLMRLKRLDFLSIEINFPCADGIQAAQHIDCRRLAGAVGADQAEYFTLIHLERQGINGLQPAEALRDTVYF